MAGLVVAAVLARLLVGGEGLGFPESGAIWEIRGFRVVIGVVVGVGLSVSGVLLQSLLRNPLASPDLLGLATGAGLGITIWMVGSRVISGGGASVPMSSPPAVAALAGSFGALVIVYVLGQRRGLIDPIALILVGVIVSVICSAATLLLQHMLPDRGLAASRWMLGAINEDVSTGKVWLVGIVTLAIVGWSVWMGRAMDVCAMSEEEAASVGVAVGRLRLGLFVGAGVLTAGAVVLAGPIGFVGLVCPHAVRLLAGPSHRVLIIGAALAGAALVVGADALVKGVMLPSGRLPIGVLTSMIGGPVFLWLLFAELRGRGR